MTWGQQNTEAEGHEQMDYAVAQGINFFDAAELYPVPGRKETQGATEEIIGTWFKKHNNRSKVILATKIAGPSKTMTHIRNPMNFSSAQIREAVAGSLKRLQTDYIDLYQLHWPERNVNNFGQLGYKHNPDEKWNDNFREVISTLNELIKEGKIRHWGLSNETPWGVMHANHVAKQNNFPGPITIQNPYSLLNRTYEIGLSEVSMRENIGLLAYSPLAFGTLSGKYLNNQKPAEARITLFPSFSRYNSPEAFKATEMYINLAKQHNISPVKMALAYVTSKPFVTANIVGATKMEQLKENIDSIHFTLDKTIEEGIESIHKKQPNPAP